MSCSRVLPVRDIYHLWSMSWSHRGKIKRRDNKLEWSKEIKSSEWNLLNFLSLSFLFFFDYINCVVGFGILHHHARSIPCLSNSRQALQASCPPNIILIAIPKKTYVRKNLSIKNIPEIDHLSWVILVVSS